MMCSNYFLSHVKVSSFPVFTIIVCSSPVDVPRIKYGFLDKKSSTWTWLDVTSPISRNAEKVFHLVANL